MAEMASALKTKLHRTAAEIAYRRERMNLAFPEAMVTVPDALAKAIDCIPDEDDKHVLAAAIMAHANVIVTQNTKHFPADCLEEYGVLCQKADDFLIHQFHLCEQFVLDKLDDQGMGISRDRMYVISSLKQSVPELAKLLEDYLL